MDVERRKNMTCDEKKRHLPLAFAGSSLKLEPEGLCISGRCDCSTGYRLLKPQGSDCKSEPADGGLNPPMEPANGKMQDARYTMRFTSCILPLASRSRFPAAGSSLQLEPEGLCISGRCDCSTGYRLLKPQGSDCKSEPADGESPRHEPAAENMMCDEKERHLPPFILHPSLATHPRFYYFRLRPYYVISVLHRAAGIPRLRCLCFRQISLTTLVYLLMINAITTCGSIRQLHATGGE